MSIKLNSCSLTLALSCLCAGLIPFAACNRGPSQPGSANQQSGAKRYPFKGKVVSIDKQAAAANIDNEPIAGFMDAMVMSYNFKPPSALDQLQPGDSIAADVVVDSDKYWLENVKITGHSATPAAKPSASTHIPATGDDVPDFKLVNQSGKSISLRDYRGQTLLLTLVYTRCPFPDFCPRVSHEFAAIDRQIKLNPARYGRTHLLSVSFDPAHDTPGFCGPMAFPAPAAKIPPCSRTGSSPQFRKNELPGFANYFALTYKEEGGLFTHSLSTAVISPDGRIFKWYHGADWQASDLLEDIAAASHSSS